MAPPTSWLTTFKSWMTRSPSLHSHYRSFITTTLRPPLCLASVLRFLWGFHLNRSLNIETTGSHVPRRSLYQRHAASMPAAVWSVSRYLPDSSQVNYTPLVLTTSLSFRQVISGSLVVRLIDAHLIPSSGTFSSTLTTMALDHSSLRWFEASSCKAASEGLPPSPT